MSDPDPSKNDSVKFYRKMGTASIAIGLLILIFGQLRFEIQMLTNFRDENVVRVSTYWFLWIASIAISCGCLGRWILTRMDESYPNPNALYNQLCKAHSIDGKESRWLENIASRLEVDDPSKLFVDPRFLQALSEESANQSECDASAGETENLEGSKKQSMLRKIFGLGKRATSSQPAA